MRSPYRAWWIVAFQLTVLLLAPHIVPLRSAVPGAADARVMWQEEVPAGDKVLAGEVLFKHEWRPNDPLAAGGDGLGPVYNAASCVACHNQGGGGGAGGLEHNVTLFLVSTRDGAPPRAGVLHARGAGYQDTLQGIDPNLPPVSLPSLKQFTDRRGSSALLFTRGVNFAQRNTPALFGARLIDELPEEVILNMEKDQRVARGTSVRPRDVPAGRALRLADGRIGRFGWKAQTASLSDFVRAACANELGLSNPGHPQPRPLGNHDYPERGLDLTDDQCDQITAFVASLPRPVERLPASAADSPVDGAGSRASGDVGKIPEAIQGKAIFRHIGCADCHTPDLGPITGIYSDLLLHDMGQVADAGGSYGEARSNVQGMQGPMPGEWRTPPLWGVADSAPYLHDGRAATLLEAIGLHDGEGLLSAQRFIARRPSERDQLLAFLKTLRAP